MVISSPGIKSQPSKTPISIFCPTGATNSNCLDFPDDLLLMVTFNLNKAPELLCSCATIPCPTNAFLKVTLTGIAGFAATDGFCERSRGGVASLPE